MLFVSLVPLMVVNKDYQCITTMMYCILFAAKVRKDLSRTKPQEQRWTHKDNDKDRLKSLVTEAVQRDDFCI